jgi:Zn-dependent peptidase ImmA (M78 family)
MCLDKAGTVKTPLERACDRFAAMVLMPAEVIIPWYYELEENPLCRVDVLAHRCGVSKQAMSIRLKELRLP